MVSVKVWLAGWLAFISDTDMNLQNIFDKLDRSKAKVHFVNYYNCCYQCLRRWQEDPSRPPRGGVQISHSCQRGGLAICLLSKKSPSGARGLGLQTIWVLLVGGKGDYLVEFQLWGLVVMEVRNLYLNQHCKRSTLTYHT